MIEPHKHCPICGSPIPLKERFCSARCENIFAQNQRKVLRTRRILYIVFVVFVALYLFVILSK